MYIQELQENYSSNLEIKSVDTLCRVSTDFVYYFLAKTFLRLTNLGRPSTIGGIDSP